MSLRYLFPVLGLTAALLLLGCEQREEAGEMTEEAAPALEPGEALEGDLETVNQSGVTGTVRMSHVGNQVEIDLSVDGAIEGQRYVAHLHRGECGNDLGVVTTLGDLTATAGENLISATVDPASLEPWQSYFVQVHGADQRPVACAALPGHGPGEATSPAGAKTARQGETY